MKQLSKEFTKLVKRSDQQYFFSAIASDILTRERFDGIIYPSVKGSGVGINIAVKPCVIDSQRIAFVGSFNVEIVSDGNNISIG